ncbi:MAG: hypothetical protein WAS94_01045 [Candidatus Saccharimonadales bacterium]
MINKLKKTKDLSGVLLHALLSLMLPAAIYILIQNFSLYSVAIMLVVLSKWRVFMVKPRFWLDNIKANGVDFVLGVSVVVTMYLAGRGGPLDGLAISSRVMYLRLALALFYVFWLIMIKHFSSKLGVTIQSYVSVILGLIAAFWYLAFAPQVLVGVAVVLIISAASYHIRLSYQDSNEGNKLSLMWLLITSYSVTFLFNYTSSYSTGGLLILTSSGLLLTISFIGFETSYYLLKSSKSNSISSIPLVLALLFSIIICLFL